MNFRRGLFRAWLVASGAWIVGWFFYIWATCDLKHVPGQEPANLYVTLCYTGFGGWMTQVQYFTVWDYLSIALSGVAVPIAAFVLGVCILWTIDGFRANQKSN
jgi:hypothetical protein